MSHFKVAGALQSLFGIQVGLYSISLEARVNF